MPIFTRTCTVSGDAGYSNDNGDFGTNVIDFGQYPNMTGYDWDAFIRFPNVLVPRGASIVSAYIDGFAYAETETVRVYIKANDVANASAPTSKADHASKVRTSASVTWEITAAWSNGQAVQTPEIASVLQGIFDKPTWVAGNALMVMIDEYNSYDDIRALYVYATNPAYAPVLTIEYRIASPFMMILRSRI
ncbi:MAG: hypothetical protein HN413_08065 [Chloroflexi bacterium]|jgi:hypothetical protein|nr:hypothetical protein [Chloroflexota bacterium]